MQGAKDFSHFKLQKWLKSIVPLAPNGTYKLRAIGRDF